MRGFATSGGVVVPSFDLAARTGHKVSGGGGGGGRGGVAFFRRFFTTAAKNTAMAIRLEATSTAATPITCQVTAQEGDMGSEAIFAQRGGHQAQGLPRSELYAAVRTYARVAQCVSGAYTARAARRLPLFASVLQTASGKRCKTRNLLD